MAHAFRITNTDLNQTLHIYIVRKEDYTHTHTTYENCPDPRDHKYWINRRNTIEIIQIVIKASKSSNMFDAFITFWPSSWLFQITQRVNIGQNNLPNRGSSRVDIYPTSKYEYDIEAIVTGLVMLSGLWHGYAWLGALTQTSNRVS